MSGLLGPLTANPQMLAQALKSRQKPQMTLKPVTQQGLLDTAALATSPVPLVGDAVGLLADASRFANEPESRTPLNFGLAALGLLPFVPNAGAVKKMTQYEKAHEIAQKNAALPVEKGGLGLPPNNTAMDRAKAMGAVDAYHGTASDVSSIDKSMLGSATGAQSAKDAFWAASSPSTAEGYAHYAANSAPVKRLIDQAGEVERLAQRSKNPQQYWDKYDDLLRQAEELETTLNNNRLNGQNVMPLKLIPKTKKVADAKGAEFTDMEGGVNNLIKGARRGKKDMVEIQNLADDVGFNGRPTTHFGVLNPSVVRSRFAAFDPMRRNENNLLANVAPFGLAGLLGLGLYDMKQGE